MDDGFNLIMSVINQLKKHVATPTAAVLIALSVSHGLNDLLQAVVSAMYPMLKTDLNLSFAQIGLVTLVYQMAASVFQPVVGWVFDRRPFAYSLPLGMLFTVIGIVVFSYCSTLAGVCVAVFLVGVGSATLHPEASRITSLAGRARRGFAQSVFQVGGNFGGSLGPLLVALIVAPNDRRYVMWFLLAAALCFMAMRPICNWYRNYLKGVKAGNADIAQTRPLPLGKGKTLFAIGVIVVLILSKYIYMASITNYYTFYLIEKFGVTVSMSQVFLFIFAVSTAAGTLVGGPIGDRYGRKPVIWISILGTAPFSLLLPGASLPMTAVLSFCAGFMLSSAFPAILIYAQELLPTKLGMISGFFFGFAFGVAGIAAAVLGDFIDIYGINAIYRFCSFTPLFGAVAILLPNIEKKRK